MHVFEICDDGERYCYVASSGEDAIGQHHEIWGDLSDEHTIYQIDDDDVIQIWNEDDGTITAKAAREWADERGMISTTNF